MCGGRRALGGPGAARQSLPTARVGRGGGLSIEASIMRESAGAEEGGGTDGARRRSSFGAARRRTARTACGGAGRVGTATTRHTGQSSLGPCRWRSTRHTAWCLRNAMPRLRRAGKLANRGLEWAALNKQIGQQTHLCVRRGHANSPPGHLQRAVPIVVAPRGIRAVGDEQSNGPWEPIKSSPVKRAVPDPVPHGDVRRRRPLEQEFQHVYPAVERSEAQCGARVFLVSRVHICPARQRSLHALHIAVSGSLQEQLVRILLRSTEKAPHSLEVRGPTTAQRHQGDLRSAGNGSYNGSAKPWDVCCRRSACRLPTVPQVDCPPACGQPREKTVRRQSLRLLLRRPVRRRPAHRPCCSRPAPSAAPPALSSTEPPDLRRTRGAHCQSNLLREAKRLGGSARRSPQRASQGRARARERTEEHVLPPREVHDVPAPAERLRHLLRRLDPAQLHQRRAALRRLRDELRGLRLTLGADDGGAALLLRPEHDELGPLRLLLRHLLVLDRPRVLRSRGGGGKGSRGECCQALAGRALSKHVRNESSRQPE